MFVCYQVGALTLYSFTKLLKSLWQGRYCYIHAPRAEHKVVCPWQSLEQSDAHFFFIYVLHSTAKAKHSCNAHCDTGNTDIKLLLQLCSLAFAIWMELMVNRSDLSLSIFLYKTAFAGWQQHVITPLLRGKHRTQFPHWHPILSYLLPSGVCGRAV